MKTRHAEGYTSLCHLLPTMFEIVPQIAESELGLNSFFSIIFIYLVFGEVSC